MALVPSAWLGRDPWTRTAWTAEALAFSRSRATLHPVEHLSTLPPMPAPRAVEIQGADTSSTRPEPLAAPPADQSRRSATGSAPGVDKPLRDPSDAATHFSVVDGNGTAVAVTQTLGGPFGSGLLEPLGFFYQALPSHRVPPVAPTVVTRDGAVELVLGSAGGDRAVDAVVQVLSRVIDLEQPIEDAVPAARLHVAPVGERGRLFLEGVVWQDSTSVRSLAYPTWGAHVDALMRARGFATGEQPSGPSPLALDAWFGGVNVVSRGGDPWKAVGDERRGALGGVLSRGAPYLRPTDPAAIAAESAPEG
jgi:gamma-glutamyltranspeptidase